MSFFIEDGKTAITLFFAGGTSPATFQKKLSGELGGTFYSKLKSERGYYPAWIFERHMRFQVEEFIEEVDDTESITSYPDVDAILDEMSRRLERAEMEICKLKRMMEYKS